jgi:transposase
MHLCILDHDGHVVLDRQGPWKPKAFLDASAPFREGIGGGGACLFGWYWLADRCLEQQPPIPFVLGHALDRKALHGGKAKNDRLDAGQSARRLRGGTLPLAYVYPKGMRETRDLLRRRRSLVNQRADLLTHLQLLTHQDKLPPFPTTLAVAAHRDDLAIAQRFADPSVQHNATLGLAWVEKRDELIAAAERYRTRTATVDDVPTDHRLRSIPGVGQIRVLIRLDERPDVGRGDHVGQFLSYARLVRGDHEAAGKKLGAGGQKIGNAPWRWAFGEAACLFLRCSERARPWKQQQAKNRGPAKALAIRAAQLGRAVFHLLRKHEAFDANRFWSGNA